MTDLNKTARFKQNAQNMGGPSFNPDIGDSAKNKDRRQPAKRDKAPRQILKEDQVPPV